MNSKAPVFYAAGPSVGILPLITGVVLIVALTKLTSLLPDRFYFSFSKALTNVSSVKLELSNFIVAPTGVKWERFCELAKQKNITAATCAGEDDSGEKEKTAQEAAMEDKARQEVHDIIKEEGLKYTVLSSVIRFIPALISGYLVLYIFGPSQLFSAAAAGAASAFISIYPVVLLWDVVVSQDWAEYKPYFMVMYCIYAAAYFYLCKLGGLLYLRFSAPESEFSYEAPSLLGLLGELARGGAFTAAAVAINYMVV